MGRNPVQRQMLPSERFSISALVVLRLPLATRKECMFITNPGVQKPHCEPLHFAIRYWTGLRPSGLTSGFTLPSPSTVVIAMPSSEQTGRRQELIERLTTLSVAASLLDKRTVH